MRKIAILYLFILFVAMGIAFSAAKPASQINTGTNTGIIGVKIAVPEFQPMGSDTKSAALAAVFNKVLFDDLDYSGGLNVISRSFYPLGKFGGPGDIKPEAWTAPAVNAEFIAFGSIQAGGGSMSVEARLWDLKTTQNRDAMPGQRFKSDDTDEGARLIAHKFADAIITFLSGSKGIAQTSIAFVSERSPLVKELYVMDYDGANQHAMTGYKSTVISPAWSPDGEKIAFTSWRRGSADIDILSRVDLHPYTFDRPGGTTTTPAWSPDGSKIAFASSRDGSDMEIYVADWNGKNLRRLTVSKSVDISPVWSPTGREIAFTSDRNGSPQIYIMDADGTNVRRLIQEGGHAVNPAWSPTGQYIAFAWQRQGPFDIYIHDLATGKSTQITHDAGDHEKPTWAPDGRHIAFESSRTGTRQIFSMLLDGTKVRQLTNVGKNTGPAWSGLR